MKEGLGEGWGRQGGRCRYEWDIDTARHGNSVAVGLVKCMWGNGCIMRISDDLLVDLLNVERLKDGTIQLSSRGN